jgi:hypothetical protein
MPEEMLNTDPFVFNLKAKMSAEKSDINMGLDGMDLIHLMILECPIVAHHCRIPFLLSTHTTYYEE